MKKPDNQLPSLAKLQAKIDTIKKAQGEQKDSSKTDMSQAIRLIVDLSAGVIMGTGCGYLADKFFGTLPLFMIIGLFLGMAAGVKNMLKSAELIEKKLNKKQNDTKNE